MNPEPAARPVAEATSAAFHPVDRRGDCPYCTGARPPADLSPFVDVAYCISLREEPWRAEKVADLFHEIGLCRSVTLYRPTRGVEFSGAVWASHREIARHALAQGVERALIFEDDVSLPLGWPGQRGRILKALQKLPADWMGFFLGHRPVQGHFVRRDVLRVRSMYTHAYIANRPLLQWLAGTEPMDPRIPVRGPNIAIDSAFANLPGMYALFPMIATQRFMGEYRFDTARTDAGARRSLLDPARYQYLTKYHGLRPAEILAVLASPFHRFTLETFRKRSGVRRSEDASLIHASGLVDDAYYRETYPGVAASGMSSMMHYVWFGARERRNPNPLFDTAFYLGQNPRLRHPDENPLAHFLRTGAAEGLDPHPSFSTSAYVASHPEIQGSGVNPLVHFVRSRAAG